MTNSHARIAGLLLLACAAPTMASDAPLRWAGCEAARAAFMNDLATAWATQSGQQIDLARGDGLGGIREVAADRADLGGACAVSGSESPESLGVEVHPVVWEALAVVVNPENPIAELSREQLYAVFSGQVASWSELGGPDRPIRLFTLPGGREEMERVMGLSETAGQSARFGAVLEYSDPYALGQAVGRSPGAIGLTSAASLERGGLKVLRIDGVPPSTEKVKVGEYPLYRPLYLVVKPDSERGDALRRFLQFAQSQTGRDLIRRDGVVPYTEALSLVVKRASVNEGSGL
jgi:phosphate transport system substrate-binding protein